MSWFRLDDSFYDHPKVQRAGNAAIGLWIRCATYAARHLTDGRVPIEIARRYGRSREIETLLDAGLWIANGTDYIINDYLDYNPSAADIRKRRSEEAAAKRQGGLARVRNARRHPSGQFLPAVGNDP